VPFGASGVSRDYLPYAGLSLSLYLFVLFFPFLLHRHCGGRLLGGGDFYRSGAGWLDVQGPRVVTVGGIFYVPYCIVGGGGGLGDETWKEALLPNFGFFYIRAYQWLNFRGRWGGVDNVLEYWYRNSSAGMVDITNSHCHFPCPARIRINVLVGEFGVLRQGVGKFPITMSRFPHGFMRKRGE